MQSMAIPSFPASFVKSVLEGRADIALEQVEIARTALSAYREEMTLIQNQRDQIRQKIADALSELRSIEDAVQLVREEQNIIAPMVEKGYEPRLRLVQIKQKLQDAESKETKLKNQVSLLACGTALLLLVGTFAPASFMQHFIVFVLSVFVGFQVIWNVSHSLHTPLMAVTNAISSIIILGAALQIGSTNNLVIILAGVSVFFAGINIFGGFLVTRRMLAMFQKS